MAERRSQPPPADRAKHLGDLSEQELRDVATPAMVERVWARLDANIEPRRAPAGQRPLLVWALAASAATFAVGVWVGQGLTVTATPGVAVQAEPQLDVGAAVLSEPTREAPARLLEHRTEVPDVERNRGPSRGRRVPKVAPTLAPSELQFETPDEDPSPGELEGPLPLALPDAAEQGSPPKWQRLANAGDYEAALFELGQSGGFEARLLDVNAEQLMLLADVARATGQTQRALAALRRILSEFRGDPVAPLAAFSLGNLLERSGDDSGAARAFAVYRALSPEGDFAEDALVRQMRSAVEHGDRDEAEQLAAQYRASFPDGRRETEIDDWLAELAAREHLASSDAGALPPPAAQDDEGENEDSAPPAPSADAPADTPSEEQQSE